MVDENLGGTGYVSTDGVGIQAKSIREDKNDKWRLRCRRVTVPIVQEPAAAWKITGVAAASTYRVTAPLVLAVDEGGHRHHVYEGVSSSGCRRLRPSISWLRAWRSRPVGDASRGR